MKEEKAQRILTEKLWWFRVWLEAGDPIRFMTTITDAHRLGDLIPYTEFTPDDPEFPGWHLQDILDNYDEEQLDDFLKESK